MTVAMRPFSMALQLTGLSGSVAGAVLTVALAPFVVLGWVVAGIIAIVLDVIAIRARSVPNAVGAAIGKVGVVLVALVTVTLGAAASPVDTELPAETGPLLLLLSVVPSLLGAAFRRVDP